MTSVRKIKVEASHGVVLPFPTSHANRLQPVLTSAERKRRSHWLTDLMALGFMLVILASFQFF